jgi:hypothetical protein
MYLNTNFCGAYRQYSESWWGSNFDSQFLSLVEGSAVCLSLFM